jgi:hypothetical protein
MPDNADLCSARRWAWYCKDPACPKYWSAWSYKSNFWLHLYETVVHRADVRRHTGGTSRAGEGDHGEKYHHSTCLATTDCTCYLQMQHNIRFSKTTAVLGPAHSAINWQEVERDVAANIL